jgi:phosphoglycolate phosphatase
MIIIFDLDGTLLNTIDDLGYACNFALGQSGYPTHPIADYPKMVGNGINNLIRRALPVTERTEENVQYVRIHFVSYYNRHNCDYTRPYDGIRALLATLKAEGHQLAVASNKYQVATEKIVTHFFPDTFDVILGERDGVNRKPDPRIVFDIVESEKSKVESSQVLYIGDSLVDMQTAQNAGVPFIACSWGFVPRNELVAAGVTHIADTPGQIIELLKERV